MSNWFESSPARSVVIHTLVVAAAVWAAFNFVFDENKVNHYKAKTEVLEVEIARLREENKKYHEWLTSTPNTIPFLETKLKTLIAENAKLSTELISAPRPAAAASATTSEPPSKTYVYSRALNVGESFIDPQTNAILGIGLIARDFTAAGVLTLPDGQGGAVPTLKVGDSWKYPHGGKRYQLTLSKVDWYTNRAEVTVREMDGTK
jgi:hypothetical protein